MFAALLAVVMVFALTACSVSSSSTSTVSTSVTDSEGNTTTHTTTTEAGPDGVTTTNETTTETSTTPDEDTSEDSLPTAEELAEAWHERYIGGAHGTSKDGDEIYFAFDDLNTLSSAYLMDITEEGTKLSAYEGDVYEDEDGLILEDDNLGRSVRFTLTDNGDDTLLMTFLGDGDEVTLTVVDEDTIIDQMAAVWADFVG